MLPNAFTLSCRGRWLDATEPVKLYQEIVLDLRGRPPAVADESNRHRSPRSSLSKLKVSTPSEQALSPWGRWAKLFMAVAPPHGRAAVKAGIALLQSNSNVPFTLSSGGPFRVVELSLVSQAQ